LRKFHIIVLKKVIFHLAQRIEQYKRCSAIQKFIPHTKGKGKMHPCTGTEALYRPYGP